MIPGVENSWCSNIKNVFSSAFSLPMLFQFFMLLLFSDSYCSNAIYPAAQFASLKSSEINLRVGPGTEYPVAWVLMKSNLPVMVVAEFDQWRKIKLWDDTSGWVHKNMISRKNAAIVVGSNTILFKYASTSHPIAMVEKGVVLRVLKRENDWIKVDIHNFKGWIDRKKLWGVNDV